jgi:hypothetical protein
MQIHEEFPTKIGTFEFKDAPGLMSIKELNRGLTQSLLEIRDKDLSSTEQFSMSKGSKYSVVRIHISLQIQEYLMQALDLKIPEGSVMVSWAMLYGAGDWSKAHTHPGADLSVTYYPQVPEELSSLKVKENKDYEVSRPGAFTYLDPRPAARWDVNLLKDSNAKEIMPVEGQGAITPGWLEHYVTPHHIEGGLRICIASNVFIDKGTWTKDYDSRKNLKDSIEWVAKEVRKQESINNLGNPGGIN